MTSRPRAADARRDRQRRARAESPDHRAPAITSAGAVIEPGAPAGPSRRWPRSSPRSPRVGALQVGRNAAVTDGLARGEGRGEPPADRRPGDRGHAGRPHPRRARVARPTAGGRYAEVQTSPSAAIRPGACSRQPHADHAAERDPAVGRPLDASVSSSASTPAPRPATVYGPAGAAEPPWPGSSIPQQPEAACQSPDLRGPRLRAGAKRVTQHQDRRARRASQRRRQRERHGRRPRRASYRRDWSDIEEDGLVFALQPDVEPEVARLAAGPATAISVARRWPVARSAASTGSAALASASSEK